jgi:branched-subunit amino acid transport protein
VTVLVALVGAVVVSWFLRVLVITVIPASRLPERVRRSLPDLTPVVLAALVAAAIVGGGAAPNPSILAGVAVTGLVAWRTHRIGLSIAAGLATAAVIVLV